MISKIISKLPFINKADTLAFYCEKLGFSLSADYGDYLIMKIDDLELHFFAFANLIPDKSDFMIYLVVDTEIDLMYNRLITSGVDIHPNAPIEDKIWGQREFAIIDPNGTLLTFGQSIS
jgi:uncharacterized glyoxalase superfamily protein PhnB